MKNKSYKKFYFIILICFFNKFSNAQQHLPPGVNWQRSDWYPNFPGGSPNRDDSGEDWWYYHQNSFDIGGTGDFDGYICAGYSSFASQTFTETSGCFQNSAPSSTCYVSCDFEDNTASRWKGTFYGVLSKISPDGRRKIWTHHYFVGDFWQVIQTSNGDYIGVGTAFNTYDLTNQSTQLAYNPTSSQQNQYFTNGSQCTLGNNVRHAIVVKVDKNGNEIWKYLYGLDNYSINSSQAYSRKTEALAIIETTNGNFRIVGYAKTNSTSEEKPIYFEIDNNGYLNWMKVVDNLPSANNGRAGAATTISKYYDGSIDKYVLGGYLDIPLSIGGDKRNAWICQYSNTTNMPTSSDQNWFNWTSYTNNVQTNSNNSSTWDAQSIKTAFATNETPQIIFPVLFDCNFCYSSGNNIADGKIYIVDGTTGAPYSGCTTNPYTIPDLHAYDLKIRVQPLNEGYGVISTKRPTASTVNTTNCVNDDCATSTYPFGYWNSDAYVSKVLYSFASNGNVNDQILDWEKTFDADDDAPSLFPGDLKKQECMYSITSNPIDGGFVIAGNYSENFDDCYLVKLYNNCTNEQTFTIDAAHLTNQIIDVSMLPMGNTITSAETIRGSLHILSGQTLTITGSSAILQFADSKRCGIITNIVVEPGGKLYILDHATLKPIDDCTDAMWDGVEVWGDPTNAGHGNPYQGYCRTDGDVTIADARLGIIADKGSRSYNTLGVNPSEQFGGGELIIQNTNFINNRRSIHFAPYFKGFNLSYLLLNNFSCNGPMRDPDYHDDDLNPVGVNTFVTINQREGIKIFNQNTFYNTGNFDFDKRGTAIGSFDASYEVRGNYIAGTTYGLTIWQANLIKGVSVVNNDISCIYGITCLGGSFHNISGNNFQIPIGVNTGNNQFQPWGIVTDNSGAFSISNNYFTGSSNSNNYGVIVHNSSALGGYVGKENYFDETTTGFQAESNNDYLQIHCNHFNIHDYCWQVSPQFGTGTLSDQGISCNPGDQAGNTFDGTYTNDMIFSNAAFTYWAAGNPSTTVPTASVVATVSNCQNLTPDESCKEEPPCDPPCDILRAAYFETEDPIKKKQLFNKIIFSFMLADTIGNDSTWLGFINDSEDSEKYRLLVQYSYFKQDYIHAIEYLEQLTLQNGDDDRFVILYNYLLSKSDPLITVDDIPYLNEIANVADQAGSSAKAMIINSGFAEFSFIPEQHNEENERFSNNSKNIVVNYELISFAPQPANQNVNVHLNSNFQGPALFILSDITGREILSINITDVSKDFIIGTSFLSHGLYLARVSIGLRTIGIGRLIVIR